MRYGTRMQLHYVKFVNSYHQHFVVEWERVCFNGRTSLYVCPVNVNASVNRNKIIVPIVIQFLATIEHAFRFLDGNATSHRARSWKMMGLNRCRSPDLNPVEHIWDAIFQRLDNYVLYPSATEDLRVVLPIIRDVLPRYLSIML